MLRLSAPGMIQNPKIKIQALNMKWKTLSQLHFSAVLAIKVVFSLRDAKALRV